jgi:hypothetical protein
MTTNKKVEMTAEAIKKSIHLNEYKVERNPKSMKSVVWETLYCIYDEEGELIEDFIQCIDCKSVIVKPSGSSTKNLLNHTKKCSEKHPKELKQGTIDNL